jgi:hypothetical protein
MFLLPYLRSHRLRINLYAALFTLLTGKRV